MVALIFAKLSIPFVGTAISSLGPTGNTAGDSEARWPAPQKENEELTFHVLGRDGLSTFQGRKRHRHLFVKSTGVVHSLL
jgi:hypothetical protein